MEWEFLSVVQCNPMPCVGGCFNNRQDDAPRKFYGKTSKKEVLSKYSIAHCRNVRALGRVSYID